LNLPQHPTASPEPALPAPLAASLELRELACARGNRRLFAGTSTCVRAGELMRVQGPNGAGKTTLLRTLCGLSTPTEGEVRWCGQPVAHERDSFHRDLIYIGHAAALKDDLTARENLLAACLLGGQHPTEEQVLAALRAAGLRQREHLSARSLSQGQRRRVSLARLVLGESSRLWILDEPFNALDTDATAWLLGVLEAQLRRGGIVVLTSHMPVAIDPALPQVVLSL